MLDAVVSLCRSICLRGLLRIQVDRANGFERDAARLQWKYAAQFFMKSLGASLCSILAFAASPRHSAHRVALDHDIWTVPCHGSLP